MILFLALKLFAAQRVNLVGETSVYTEPNSGSAVIETLSDGQEITVSNFPTAGFYKARTPSGQIGWIAEGNTSIAAQTPGAVSEPSKTITRSEPQTQAFKKFEIGILGGIDLFNSQRLGAIIQNEVFTNGPHFGLEFGFLPIENLIIQLRGEWIFKFVKAVNSQESNDQYQIDISSFPILLGPAYEFNLNPSFGIRLNVYGGFALATSLKSQYLQASSNNTTSLSSSPFTFLGTAQFTFKPSPIFNLYLEAGYRYLKVKDLTSANFTQVGAGAELFTGQTFDIDFSGLMFGAGVRFKF